MSKPFSVVVPGFILASNLPPLAKLLYGLLVFRQGDNDRSYWGLRAMARDLNVTKTAIQKSVDKLVNAGFLQVDRGNIKTAGCKGSTNIYKIKRPPERTLVDSGCPPERTLTSTREDSERPPERTNTTHTKVTSKLTCKKNDSDSELQEIKVTPREFYDYYNTKAKNTKAAAATKLTSVRVKKIKTRLKDPDFAKGWRDIIDRAFRSPFLMSEIDPEPGQKRFQLKIDFIVRNDTIWVWIIEGKYDDRNSGSDDESPTEEQLAAWVAATA